MATQCSRLLELWLHQPDTSKCDWGCDERGALCGLPWERCWWSKWCHLLVQRVITQVEFTGWGQTAMKTTPTSVWLTVVGMNNTLLSIVHATLPPAAVEYGADKLQCSCNLDTHQWVCFSLQMWTTTRLWWGVSRGKCDLSDKGFHLVFTEHMHAYEWRTCSLHSKRKGHV